MDEACGRIPRSECFGKEGRGCGEKHEVDRLVMDASKWVVCVHVI